VDDYLLSLLLGIIEGLTEFLPVSSTAHLRIAEQIFGLDLGSGYWKMYAIVIQLGAILCLPIYFRKRIAKFLSTFPNGERGDRTAATHPLTLVMIAFVVTAAPAFLLSKLIGKHLENLAMMAWALIIGGIVMWVVDAIFSKKFRVEHMEQMSLGQAVWIGACQVLSAVFPGTSRSMSTIAAGQIAGMSREAALEFSFFLSMPTMAAATLYDLLKFLRHGGMAAMNRHEWIILVIGFVVSFFVAWAVVAWFMHWVRRHGFVPFAIYRILAGIVVLVWLSRLM
jgi:undecaprenyl-diphosphatase